MNKKWTVGKPSKSCASGKLMYGIEGADVVDDYEDWGFTKECAQLIASAPELLAALELIAGEYREDAATWMRGVARAAIAKARGEA
jgi:hypothetical protein